MGFTNERKRLLFYHNHKRSLKAAFYTAIQDDCIRKNPFDFHINTVIEDDTEPKIPLSPMQEESLLSFVKSDKVYYKLQKSFDNS